MSARVKVEEDEQQVSLRWPPALPLHAAAPPDSDDDDGAIAIVDGDGEEEGALLGEADGIDTLPGTSSVLVGGEEVPPMLGTDYATAFFNTDPRIAFDALHIGALRTIERREGLTWSLYDSTPWYVPPATYVPAAHAAAAFSAETPCFVVEAMHPIVKARKPIGREEQRVDVLITKANRRGLLDAIGPEVLERLRTHRSRKPLRRRRRSPPPPAARKKD